MKYTQSLNERKVVLADLVQMNLDITDWINTHKTPAANFDKSCLSFRHLARPPAIALCCKKDPITVSVLLTSGWYASDLLVSHEATVSELEHQDGGSYPTIEVAACVGMTNADPTKAGIHKACIGITADHGATWTPLDGLGGRQNTVRMFGFGCGQTLNYYDSPVQTHYITGAGGYYPKNYMSDRMVELVATFGGNNHSFADPTILTDYCIMFDSPRTGASDPCVPWGFLTLDASDPGI